MARTLTDRSDRRGRASVQPAVAHLAIALDYERPAQPSTLHALADVDEVVVGRGDRDRVTRTARALAIARADPRLSQRHARLARTGDTWSVEDLGSRNGTFVDGARVRAQVLAGDAWVELGRTAFRFFTQPAGDAADVTAADAVSPIGAIATFSTAFARTLADLARIAFTRQSVLVHGESGTGKELVARGLHAASRRSGAFVAVNCGALPVTLVESELFGYRKGAFSGATEDRVGLVRSADGGTLFLDEIADLPLATQAALLRVLQEREVVPVGGTRPVAVDARVVAASHHDLEAGVRDGRFREDLLARLAGFVVDVPPLRDRRQDLGLLIAELLGRVADAPLRLAPDAGFALLRYGWPRNVRQLEQAIGSAAALARSGVIELEHLPPVVVEPAPPVDDLSPTELRRRDELLELLAKHRGNIAAVGRALGVARMQVHRWLERYAIDLAAYRK